MKIPLLESSAEPGPTIGYPYVKPQKFTKRYSDQDAIIRGTMFPELDMPFQNYENTRPLEKSPMHHWMELDFICLELKLYLNLNPTDKTALETYNIYKEKSAQAKQKVEKQGQLPMPWEV